MLIAGSLLENQPSSVGAALEPVDRTPANELAEPAGFGSEHAAPTELGCTWILVATDMALLRSFERILLKCLSFLPIHT